jgi:hypothetical protein
MHFCISLIGIDNYTLQIGDGDSYLHVTDCCSQGEKSFFISFSLVKFFFPAPVYKENKPQKENICEIENEFHNREFGIDMKKITDTIDKIEGDIKDGQEKSNKKD